MGTGLAWFSCSGREGHRDPQTNKYRHLLSTSLTQMHLQALFPYPLSVTHTYVGQTPLLQGHANNGAKWIFTVLGTPGMNLFPVVDTRAHGSVYTEGQTSDTSKKLIFLLSDWDGTQKSFFIKQVHKASPSFSKHCLPASQH